jgi:hypothetical protein
LNILYLLYIYTHGTPENEWLSVVYKTSHMYHRYYPPPHFVSNEEGTSHQLIADQVINCLGNLITPAQQQKKKMGSLQPNLGEKPNWRT